MKKFFASISRIWYAYVIAIIVGVLLIDYGFNVINLPRNEETITFFIVSEGNDLSNLKGVLENNKPSYLREINVYGARRESAEFKTYFDIYGKANSDVVILPESKIDEDILLNYYSSFPIDYINTFMEEVETYKSEKNELHYGVKIHAKGEDNGLITYKSEDFDEDYYAFFVSSSIHIGKLASSEWATAFSFVSIIRGGSNG